MADGLIKQITTKNSSGNLMIYNIGADAENIAYNGITVKEAIDLKQNQKLSKSIKIEGKGTYDTVETALNALNDVVGSSVAYLLNYQKNVTLAYGDSRDIALDMEGYEYNSLDVITVYINGLFALKDTDYKIVTAIGGVTKIRIMTPTSAGNIDKVNIVVFKTTSEPPEVEPTKGMTEVVASTDVNTSILTSVTIE